METAILIGLAFVAFGLWKRSTQPGLSDLPDPDVGADSVGPSRTSGSTSRTSGTTSGPSRAVAPSRTSSSAASSAGASSLAAPAVIDDAPIGWLSAVLAHGGATIGAIMEHMKKDIGMIGPVMRMWIDEDGGFHFADEYSDASIQNNFVYDNHRETPPPMFPMCGPVFFERAKESAQHNEPDDSAWGFGPTPYELEPGVWKSKSPLGGYYKEVRQDVSRPKYSDDSELPSGWAIDSSGYLQRFKFDAGPSGLPVQGLEYVYPARAVRAWSEWAVSRAWGTGIGLELVDEVTEPYHDGRIKVPSYYRSNPGRWYRRLVKWYHRCATVVWMAEMMRAHYKHSPPGSPQPPATSRVVPDWWWKHCAAWGVGHVSPFRMDRPALPNTAFYESPDVIESILHAVVVHTPPPGSPASLGSQIVPDNLVMDQWANKRSLMDMPNNVGSVDPPYSVEWYWPTAYQHKFDDWNSGDSGAFNLVVAIIEVEAALCGAGFGSAAAAAVVPLVSMVGAGAATALVSRVVSLAVQNCFRMARGVAPADVWSYGDIVGVIGEAVDIVGAGNEDIAELLPPQVWDAVKTAGAAFPQISGTNPADLVQALNSVRNSIQELRAEGWPYIDEAYGGLGMTGKAIDAIPGEKVKLF